MSALARKARDAGMARAVEHADDVRSGWSWDAYHWLQQFVGSYDAPFTAEKLCGWAYSMGLDKPVTPQAWGAVFRQAAKQGLIRKVSYVQAQGRACHMHPVTLWQVVE